VTPLDHLVAALVQLEQEAQEIEHRQSFIRSAIESFGIDADDALLVAVQSDDEVAHGEIFDPQARLRAGFLAGVGADLVDEDDHENKAPTAAWFDSNNDLVGLSYRVPGTKQWNWELIGEEIEIGDIIGTRRTKHLQTVLGVSAATAQWMVKRCRELSLIDVERPKFDQQKARDAAAAAI